MNNLFNMLSIFSSKFAYLFLILTPVILFFIKNKSKKSPKLALLPPGPKPWPIIGNLPELIRNKPTFRWVHELMKEMNTDIACIRVGNVHIIPVSCPEIAREFLKEQDATFASRPVTMTTEHSSFGFKTIAVTPSGDQWKKMRRVVASHVLNASKMKWLYTKREEESDNLVRFIYNQCNAGGIVDVREAARAYSGNVIRRLMFNKRYFGKGRVDGGPGFEEVEHVEAHFTILSLFYSFCVSDYIPSLRGFDIDGHEKIVKETMKKINKYHDAVINQRIGEWRDGQGMFYGGKKEPLDLLDVLISLEDEKGEPLLSTDEIKAQSVELVYASIDNPSNAVEWALAEMLNRPEILRQAVEEIDRVVGKERLAQESDFSKLNYVKACIRETFRLHPITPFNLPHVSNADTVVAGYLIPKGSHVLLSRMGLGRNPKVWEDPLVFKPERHLNDTSSGGGVELGETNLRFISFSTGRRACMGVALGSAMVIMLFTRVLQGFDWNLPPDHSSVDLTESADSLFMAKSLHLQAKPRLPDHVYKALIE